jgi:hypothetical protein
MVEIQWSLCTATADQSCQQREQYYIMLISCYLSVQALPIYPPDELEALRVGRYTIQTTQGC